MQYIQKCSVLQTSIDCSNVKHWVCNPYPCPQPPRWRLHRLPRQWELKTLAVRNQALLALKLMCTSPSTLLINVFMCFLSSDNYKANNTSPLHSKILWWRENTAKLKSSLTQLCSHTPLFTYTFVCHMAINQVTAVEGWKCPKSFPQRDSRMHNYYMRNCLVYSTL